MNRETRPPDATEAAVPTGGPTNKEEQPRRRLSRSKVSTIVILFVTTVAIAALAYLSDQPAQAKVTLADGTVTQITVEGAPTGEAPTVGRTAPAFKTATVDGAVFDLAALKGKAVWLTFGATWCQPCRAENPDIEAAYRRFKDRGLEVVQVYISEGQRTVSDYATTVGLTYTKIPDESQRLAAQYRILGIPSHFFIGRDGVLKVLKIGSITPDEIETNVVAILQ